MSITFRVTSDDSKSVVPPAIISIRQLVAFRHFARENRVLVDDLADGENITRTFNFQVSICRFPLAILAPLFGNETMAIAVLDEAQFTQREVRLWKAEATGELMLSVSATMDGSIDLNLAIGNAFAVMRALNLRPNNIGDLPVAVLRDRLADPRIRARFMANRVDHYLPRLDRLADIAGHEQEPRLVWA